MIKVLADSVSSEGCLLGLQQAVCSLGPLYTCISGVPWGSNLVSSGGSIWCPPRVQISFYKGISQIGL